MALTDIFAALKDLDPRQSDGSGNTAGGEVGDVYTRITDANYEDNASDSSGAGNGMLLPTTPTDNFAPTGLLFPGSPFIDILDREGRTDLPIFAPPAHLADDLVGTLPQAETISDAVMDLDAAHQNNPSSLAANELFDFIGQVITHDVAEASTLSADLPLLIDGLPFPFARTLGVVDGDGVRQQINEESSFLDLSMIYGNRDDRLDLARADTSPTSGVQSAKLLLGTDGLLPTIKEVGIDSGLTSLQVLQIYTEPGFAGLPNPNAPGGPPADATFENVYYAGDNRATQQSPLVTLQTVLAREHNHQVDQLTPYATMHGWTQDELFNAARVITEAEWQHVVFEEYVPTLIGNKADTLLDAYKSFVGAAGYDAIGAGVINEWTTVAFRFGHDQSSNDYTVSDAAGAGTVIPLAQAFSALGNFAANSGATTTEGLDAWIRGLSAQFAQEIDGKIADGNREALFGGLGGTVDLEAFDIQRGRDHGVWNYNDLRAGLGLTTYASFADFGAANGIDSARLAALSGVYGGDITKLDSIVGGLLEKHYDGSQLGATFTLLSAVQFDLLKETDQFYYEDRLAGSPELLADIKGTTFAEILERNSGSTDDGGTVSHLNLDSFHVAKAWTGSDNSKKGDTHNGSDDAAYLKADLLIGKGGNDNLYGKEGNDTLYGDAGNDKLDGGNGDDFLKGGIGNDNLYGGKGNDHAWGEDGNDGINLDGGDDWANGGVGNDQISCGDGNDIALGKEGNDDLGGGKGNDELYGGGGKDNVNGDAGDDKCYGGAGNDCVAGGAGNDRIVGEGGNDQLSGGAGYDVFAFGVGSGKDKVTDFNAKQEVIDLSELEQFDSFALVKAAMTTSRSGTTTINLGDTDGDGYSDTIELVGVSQKLLKEANFVLFHDDAPVV